MRNALFFMLIALLMTLPAAMGQGDKGGKFTEDPAATKLFKDARAARASWDGFPGFTANLTINHNGKITKTKVEVLETGKLILDLPDGELKKFVREQVGSLVGHRMGGGASKETPCAFADKDTDHPLGRKILVLGDEMGSSYRIKDNQLLEVKRQFKNSQFAITVLKNQITPEKKYLPVYFVVNNWEHGTKGIKSSWSYHHTWKRVGKYDLPETVTIAIADSGSPLAVLTVPTVEVWAITFSDHALMP